MTDEEFWILTDAEKRTMMNEQQGMEPPTVRTEKKSLSESIRNVTFWLNAVMNWTGK